MIQVLYPAWLWGLTALLIPLAIHLLSRKEGKVIPFGSTRFLTESTTTQFRSVRLNEVLLLLIRSFLILLLTLFLAGVTLETTLPVRKILIIENGIREQLEGNPILDSLMKDGYDVVTPETLLRHQSPSYWSLIKHLEEKENYDAVIVSNQLVETFKGERIALPKNVRWISVEPQEERFTLFTAKRNENSFWVRSGTTNPEVTEYTTELTDQVKSKLIIQPDTIRVRISNTTEHDMGEKILISAIKTLQTVTPRRLEIFTKESAINKKVDWTIHLGTIPASDEVNTITMRTFSHRNLPVFIPDTSGSNAGRKWYVTTKLTTPAALEKSLTFELGKILLSEPADSYEMVLDKRTLPEQQLWSKEDATPYIRSDNKRKRNNWIFLLFVIVFASERMLSRHKRQ